MRATAPELIHGIHLAFVFLGVLTIVSTIVFNELRSGDGDAVEPPQGRTSSG